jgi:small-conductance mechanosensitive channel
MPAQPRIHPGAAPLAWLVVLLLGWLAPPPAAAQDAIATVRLDGRTLFRIGPSEELEARPRARQIERQLLAALDTPQGITATRITPAGDDNALRQLSVAGRPVLQVSPADADANALSVEALAAEWAALIDSALGEARERRDSERGRFVTSVRGSIETAFAEWLESAISIIPRALASLLVLLFWGLAAGVRALTHALLRHFISDLTVENLIKQVSYYAVWMLGIIVAASAFGLEPESLATGLGLTSLALGFALKDILSNFVSGLLILTLRPFQLGDQIIIGDTEGSVERIELRATQIRTYDGRRVLVPNAETFTSRVTNNTAAPVRRASVQCRLGYEVDVTTIMPLLRETAQQTPGVLAEPAATVQLLELGQPQLLLEVQFWCDSRRSDFVATASQVRIGLLQALRAQHVTLPDEAVQTIALQTPGR